MNNRSNPYVNRIQAMTPGQRSQLIKLLALDANHFVKSRSGTVSGLTAFVVPQKGETLDALTLQSALADRLPDYMIPSDIILMDSLPKTPSGKVDRRSLPDPNSHTVNRFDEFIAPKTPIEKEIASIWSEVLEQNPVSMTDNFFELGGHSLLAVKLVALIKSRTGQDLPLAILFESPTLKDLVPRITRGKGQNIPESVRPQEPLSVFGKPNEKPIRSSLPGTQSLWSTLVPIKTEGDFLPLFLMHGIGGNVLNYSTLIPYLDKRQPVYGLQARGLDGITEPFHSVSEMTANYVSEVKKVQPRGPYLLGGGSMGGAIALEMAQQFQQEGEEILFLGLFDTEGPDARYSNEPAGFIGKSKQLLASDHVLKAVLKRLHNKISKEIKNAFFRTMCSSFRFLRQPIPQYFRYWYIHQNNIKIMNQYKPKPYSGHITLFRSTMAGDDGPDRGWTTIAVNRLEIIQIPASHGNFIEAPELGKALRSNLDKFQKQMN